MKYTQRKIVRKFWLDKSHSNGLGGPQGVKGVKKFIFMNFHVKIIKIGEYS